MLRRSWGALGALSFVLACSSVADHPAPAQATAFPDAGADAANVQSDSGANPRTGSDSGATPVSCPVDASTVYMTGWFAGKLDGYDAIAPVTAPSMLCYPLAGIWPQLRATDKAVVFVDREKNVRRFQAESWIKLPDGTWGSDPSHVDPLVPSPCGMGGTNDIWVRPTGEILFACGTTFKWADGTTFDTGSLYPRALSATHAFLEDLNDSNKCRLKAFTGQLSPLLSLGTMTWSYSKASGDGFDVVTHDIADADGSQAHELWHVNMTTATKLGTFVPKPADAPKGRLVTGVVLSGGVLYEHFAGWGVWQRPLNTGTASVLYKVPTGGMFDWTKTPPQTWFVTNGIFTGP